MTGRRIIIDIGEQVARLLENDRQIKIYPISSAINGTGSQLGTNRTPLGRFRFTKIGEGVPTGTVFRSRVATEDICTENPRSPLWQSSEDLVLSRILWLEGVEAHNLNTKDRFIYIHGTNQEHLIGSPASHGCIRLKNQDIIELFDLVDENSEVIILA